MGLVKEFKEFAMRGNVVDMAVGIVIGAAFGRIVSSFVADVVMPPLGAITGGVDFSEMRLTLKEGVAGTENAEAIPAVTLNYGAFMNSVIDFVIIAFAIFVVIKLMNAAKRKEAAAPEPPAPAKLTRDQELLVEIRDALVRRG